MPELTNGHRKPNTALGDPWPATTVIPKITQVDDCGDYESELAVVIGKQAKNVSESTAMNYVLGYTAANDVSSRTSQLNQSQWSFSKGFDGSCPLGQLTKTSLWLQLIIDKAQPLYRLLSYQTFPRFVSVAQRTAMFSKIVR